MSDSIIVAPEVTLPDWAQRTTNLADERIGACALVASDDFFAPAQRMLQHGPATFVPGKYDENGKWMDGWESRRKRGPGHDWCVVRLARPGRIVGVDLDTSFFTGNYAPAASVDACRVSNGDPDEHTMWTRLMPQTSLSANAHHFHQLHEQGMWTHLRVNIFPDGGLARLRVYGHPRPNWHDNEQEVDLVALENGGRAICCNDAHYGQPSNLILPGRGINMGDGWETRRRREPGHDWCILALGAPGRIRRIEVDTAHFKGNFPDRISLRAHYCPGAPDNGLPAQSLWWPVLLPEQMLSADSIHEFADALDDLGPVTHVRVNIHPDGGISRLRVWGQPVVV